MEKGPTVDETFTDSTDKRRRVGRIMTLCLTAIGIAAFVVAGVVRNSEDGTDIAAVLCIAGIAAFLAALVVTVANYRIGVTEALMRNLERAENAVSASFASFSNPETMRNAFLDLDFHLSADSLRRRFFRHTIVALIERSADVVTTLHRAIDRFDELFQASGGGWKRHRILLLIVYMESVRPDAAAEARSFASGQLAFQKTSPAFRDVIVPILYDETKQSFSFLEGGNSPLRAYDVGLGFFLKRILHSRG